MAEKIIKFPEMLDGFGKELQSVLSGLKEDVLKPALMSDVIKTLEAIGYIQQLLVIHYNLAVRNHEIQAGKIKELEIKVLSLMTARGMN